MVGSARHILPLTSHRALANPVVVHHVVVHHDVRFGLGLDCGGSFQ